MTRQFTERLTPRHHVALVISWVAMTGPSTSHAYLGRTINEKGVPTFKTISLCAALAFAILLSTANATPVVVGITNPAPINVEGVTTDLFDVAQGTIVTSSSALYPTFDARSAFGYASNSFAEQTRTIFADSPAITTDFIDFQTAQPINLGSYRLYLGEDGNGTDGRSATAFRLYASSNINDVQSDLVSSASFVGTYTATYGSPAILVTDSLNLSNVQFFRMEIDRSNLASDSGPRVIELDGFAPTPEPSSLILASCGLCALIASRGCRRRRSRI